MIQIALETSTRQASVCLANDAKLLGEFTVLPPKVATQALIPAIQELLTKNRLRVEDVGQISISYGPGSFTGLRMGVAVAKTFAFATGCRVFQCTTHSVIANQAVEHVRRHDLPVIKIATVINAQRKQWFVATHDLATLGNLTSVRNSTKSKVFEPQAFVDSFKGEPVLLCGDGLARTPKNFLLPESLIIASQEDWMPKASTVARLAALEPEQGQLVDPLKLMPDYGRKSAAEENLAAKK